MLFTQTGRAVAAIVHDRATSRDTRRRTARSHGRRRTYDGAAVSRAIARDASRRAAHTLQVAPVGGRRVDVASRDRRRGGPPRRRPRAIAAGDGTSPTSDALGRGRRSTARSCDADQRDRAPTRTRPPSSEDDHGGDTGEREVAVPPRHLVEGPAAARRRRAGSVTSTRSSPGLERRSRTARGRSPTPRIGPGAGAAPHADRRVERQHHGRQFGGGIGVRQAAAERAASADRRMRH